MDRSTPRNPGTQTPSQRNAASPNAGSLPEASQALRSASAESPRPGGHRGALRGASKRHWCPSNPIRFPVGAARRMSAFQNTSTRLPATPDRSRMDWSAELPIEHVSLTNPSSCDQRRRGRRYSPTVEPARSHLGDLFSRRGLFRRHLSESPVRQRQYFVYERDQLRVMRYDNNNMVPRTRPQILGGPSLRLDVERRRGFVQQVHRTSLEIQPS